MAAAAAAQHKLRTHQFLMPVSEGDGDWRWAKVSPTTGSTWKIPPRELLGSLRPSNFVCSFQWIEERNNEKVGVCSLSWPTRGLKVIF